MKICNFAVEAFLGIPIDYDNWYEHMPVELTDEQFDRYCDKLIYWQTTEEWKKWNDENGEDYFIHRDLPDIFELIKIQLVKQAPKIWDERISKYLNQINIYTAEEIWDQADRQKKAFIEDTTR